MGEQIGSRNSAALGVVGAIWGVAGIVALLVSAMVRLGKLGLEGLQHSLSAWQWTLLLLWVPFMLVSEGYRGFHRSFSPRVAARARYLATHPTLPRVVLAPLFCMGFFHATPRRKRAAWGLSLGIVLLVLLVRRLPQPWRGILDAGVVLGLAAGVLSLVYFTFLAFASQRFDHPPETPESDAHRLPDVEVAGGS